MNGVSVKDAAAALNSTVQPKGYLHNLTAAQDYQLKEAYLAILTYAGVAPKGIKIGLPAPPQDEASKPQQSRFSFRSAAPTGPGVSSNANNVQEIKSATGNAAPNDFLKEFRDSIRADHPDQLVLRFLRARKWDTAKALAQFGRTLKWRMRDWDINELLLQGEQYFIDVEPDPGFINQYKDGKVTMHGHDKQGRPLVFIHVAKHDPRAQSEKAMERYTLNVIEAARLCLTNEVTTAAVVFDLGGFGLGNMDYAVVKFILTCFEQYYPECLGYLFIHRAPWVFSGVWNIIKGWLDPVVASKISFTKNEKDLLKFIDADQIPKGIGGTSPFEYEWIAPKEGESKYVVMKEKRDQLQQERSQLYDQFDKVTLQWIQAKDEASSKQLYEERDKIAEKLYDQFWHLDPYVRARTICDRNGSLGEFKPQLAHGGVAQPTL